MSGWGFEVFMLLSQITLGAAVPQPHSISEATMPTAPPPPPQLPPAARLGRLTGLTLPAPLFEQTPFERRVDLRLVRLWSGRLNLSGFHSDVNYMAASLGDPHFRAARLTPGFAGGPSSRSFGVRLTFSWRGAAGHSCGHFSESGRVASQPH